MANATKHDEVVQVVEPAKVVLELTFEEAQALVDIFGNVGGDPAGRRGHIDSIDSSLKRLGFNNAAAAGRGKFYFPDTDGEYSTFAPPPSGLQK